MERERSVEWETLEPIADVPCNKLVFETSVIMPEASNIFDLHSGDILSVALETVDNSERLSLYHGKHYVGSVAGIMQKKLENCLRKGNKFLATVQSTQDGRVLVLLFPVAALRDELCK